MQSLPKVETLGRETPDCAAAPDMLSLIPAMRSLSAYWRANLNPRQTFALLAAVLLIFLVAGPARAASSPVISSIASVPRLTIQSPIGITNQIQYVTSLLQTNWLVLTNIVAVQTQYWFVDVTAAAPVNRYYRVVNPSVGVTNPSVTLRQLWGNKGDAFTTTNLIQRPTTATPVNTAFVAFDASHSKIWIPVSYVPNWPVGTLAYWGDTSHSMRVAAVGTGQIQFTGVSGGYYGWNAGTLIATNMFFSSPTVITASSPWVSPGVSNLVQVPATLILGSVSNIVWCGGDQFLITAIVKP